MVLTTGTLVRHDLYQRRLSFQLRYALPTSLWTALSTILAIASSRRLYCRLLLVDLVATSIYLQNVATPMSTTRLNTQLHQLRLEVLSFALGIVG